MIDRTDIWSILNDRLPIDDMLTDRFYAYIHDSEQKKMKHLQPVKKLILKQTARHNRLRKICFNSYTLHRFSTKNQFPNKPGFPFPRAMIILDWHPYVSLFPDVLCNIASSVTGLRKISFNGYTLHRFSTKNQFPKKPGFPFPRALIILDWHPYVSLFPDVLCNIASSVTVYAKYVSTAIHYIDFPQEKQFPKKPGFPFPRAMIILDWHPYVSLFPDVLCNIDSSVTVYAKYVSTAIHYIDFPQKISSQRNQDFCFPARW